MHPIKLELKIIYIHRFVFSQKPFKGLPYCVIHILSLLWGFSLLLFFVASLILLLLIQTALNLFDCWYNKELLTCPGHVP